MPKSYHEMTVRVLSRPERQDAQVGGRTGGSCVQAHLSYFCPTNAIFMACKFIQWSPKPSREVSLEDDSFSIFHDFRNFLRFGIF